MILLTNSCFLNDSACCIVMLVLVVAIGVVDVVVVVESECAFKALHASSISSMRDVIILPPEENSPLRINTCAMRSSTLRGTGFDRGTGALILLLLLVGKVLCQSISTRLFE